MSEDESISRPSDAVKYCADGKKVSVESLRIPERLILTYQRATFDCAKELVNGRCVDWLYGESQPFCVGQINGLDVGVGRFWIGAPAAAATLEEAIACGVKTIFEVGISGGIQPNLKPGDIIVVTGAVRDEGTSHHYLPSHVSVESDVGLRNMVIERLTRERIKHFVGPVWSTDAVYRETRGKVQRFRKEGILAVNMETSAVFAIAKYRNVRIASAQVVSDVLAENGWHIAFGDSLVKESTRILLRAVLEVISRE